MARSVSWEEALGLCRVERMRGLQDKYGKKINRCDHLQPLHKRRNLSGAESWLAPCSATTTPTPAHASAIRPPAMSWARHSAPRQVRRISTASNATDVVIVIGANPTDGHPVFASRLKKRLRQGAKLIVIDPRRIDLVKSAHIKRRASPAAASGYQRGRCDRAGPCDRYRRPDGRGVHPRTLRLG